MNGLYKKLRITLTALPIYLLNWQPVLAAQPTPAQLQNSLKSNPIVERLNDIINVLTGVVIIVVIGVIIFGGIQYTMAGGNPQKAADARKRITNGLTALFAFLLIWAFLQWIVPGGI